MTHHFIILPTALLARRMRGLRSLIAGTCLGLLLLPAPAAEEPDAVSEAIKGAKSEAKGKAETIKAAADALKNARETAETNLIALDELIRFQRSHGGARNPAGSRDAISKALDRAQKEVDEYGTLYLSSPTLTRAGSNEFRFDLARGASNYFADAKTNVNGRAAAFEQTANTFMLNIRAQIDPANAAAYGAEVAEFERQFGDWRDRNAALRKAADLDLGADLAAAATNTSLSASNAAVAAAQRRYATNIYGANAAPTAPSSTNHDTALPELANIFATGFTNTNISKIKGLEDFLSLLSKNQQQLQLPNRAAIITAAGDNAVEAIFRAIGDDRVRSNFVNQIVLFGLSTVTVQPGWRTQKDWAGEVQITAQLDYVPARPETYSKARMTDTKLPELVAKWIEQESDEGKVNKSGIKLTLENVPLALRAVEYNRPLTVQMVSPLTESDTFDEASSIRRQQEVAFNLSVALRYLGQKGQADAFDKFAKSRQFDIATRSSLASVSAYSGQEGTFGFQIGPRARALADPTSSKAKAGAVLERQSFPALVLVGMNKGDLGVRFRLKHGERGDQGKVECVEPRIILTQIRRWVPLKQSLMSRGGSLNPLNWGRPGLKESVRLSIGNELNEARKHAYNLGWEDDYGSGGFHRPERILALRERIQFYERQLIGSTDYIPLPPDLIVQAPPPSKPPEDTTPKITGIVPASVIGTKDRQQSFLIEGSNLGRIIVSTLGSVINANYTITSTRILTPNHLQVDGTLTGDAGDFTLTFPYGEKADSKAGIVVAPSVKVTVSGKIPEVLGVIPTSVMLNGADTGTPVTILLAGNNFDKVHLKAITTASGKINDASAALIGTTLILTGKVKDASAPLVFKLPFAGANGPETVLSLPILVQPAPKAATTSDNAAKQSSSTPEKVLSISADVTAQTLQNLMEAFKSGRPAPVPAPPTGTAPATPAK